LENYDSSGASQGETKSPRKTAETSEHKLVDLEHKLADLNLS
jgi:hypothetical protein